MSRPIRDGFTIAVTWPLRPVQIAGALINLDHLLLVTIHLEKASLLDPIDQRWASGKALLFDAIMRALYTDASDHDSVSPMPSFKLLTDVMDAIYCAKTTGAR